MADKKLTDMTYVELFNEEVRLREEVQSSTSDQERKQADDQLYRIEFEQYRRTEC
jgi:hypothetical protein